MRYEYAVCSVNLTPGQITDQYGVEGWEMCGVASPIIYLKRAILDPEPVEIVAALQKNYSPKE